MRLTCIRKGQLEADAKTLGDGWRGAEDVLKLRAGSTLCIDLNTHKLITSCPCFVSACEAHSKARRQAGVGGMMPTKKIHSLDTGEETTLTIFPYNPPS